MKTTEPQHDIFCNCDDCSNYAQFVSNFKSGIKISNNHATVSYGQLVLVDAENNAYGVNDIIPHINIAAKYLARQMHGDGFISDKTLHDFWMQDPEYAPQEKRIIKDGGVV